MKIIGQFFQILSVAVLLVIGCKSAADTANTALAPASRPAATPVSAATLSATTQSVAAFPTTTNPRDTLPFLASDELAGRLPGSAGMQRAGDFLASEFDRIGLKPLPREEGNQSGYFQDFAMAQAASVGSSTQLLINGQSETFKDFAPVSVTAEGKYKGQIVFAGFGITTDPKDENAYDDYAGLDVHGKIVLAMMKEPLNDKGASRLASGDAHWSNHALFVTKAKNAAIHGAVALLLVAPPSSGGLDEVNPYTGDGHRVSWLPVVQISRRLANEMLAKGGSSELKSLQDGIYTSFKPHSVDLKDLQAQGTIVFEHTQVNVRNVMAYLPGSGPHADEWVVVGAHYDHLGLGQMGHMTGGRTGSIWHGADDNASGTAAVLELAERMKNAPAPARSVLFIFFTAEEEGLIGSDHFVKNPLIPLDKVVAMLNLDMVGRLRSQSLQIGGAGTASSFDDMVKDAVQGTPLTTTVALPEDGGRGGMGPSDHMSFALHKIPVLFLFTGMHSDYHRPTDTADKINYDGIDELVGVAQKIVTAMTIMQRETYNAGNDDKSMAVLMGNSASGHRAVLGVVPDDSASESTKGILISGVIDGGPADKAGFKANDLLIAFNNKPLKTLGDLSQALSDAHPGDKIIVKVMRGSAELNLNTVLDERK